MGWGSDSGAAPYDRGGGRVYRADAVVLRRLNVGETDRILTLFLRDRGKLSAIVKGVRSPRSRMAGATELFTWFSGLLAQGQNLDVLTQAQVENAFPAIRKDLVRIGYASHFLEIVDKGLEDRQPMPELWDVLVAALGTLEFGKHPDLLARAFELQATTLLGYEPQLHACVLNGNPVEGPEAAFHPLRGGMLCGRCARATPGSIPLSEGTLRAMRVLMRAPLAEAAKAELPEATRRELAKCLVPYLRHHLETPLNSLQFLDDVQTP